MTTAELTSLHTEEMMETLNAFAKDRTLANIARRAQQLWENGYTAELFTTGFYFVTSPEGKTYSVICDDIMGYECTCPAFTTYGECKHHLAVSRLVQDEQQAAEYDARAAYDPYGYRF